MSARTRSTALSAAIAISLASALRAGAQSMPNINAPKAAAANAAAATNAHIQAEQNPSQQSAPPKPAAPAPMPRTNPALQGSSATTAQQPAKSSTGKGTPAKGTAAAPAPAPAAQTNSVSQRGGKSEIALMRETFAYQAENRRDPFLSLMKTGDLRPMISDLRLVAVIYDPAGRSVAILRDLQTKEQYRVKVGQTLGRMRVNQIRPNQVIFTIEEIGMTRQEALSMNDITKARSQ